MEKSQLFVQPFLAWVLFKGIFADKSKLVSYYGNIGLFAFCFVLRTDLFC